MPTYGFRCPDGHEFDRFYKTISAAPATVECPECGKPAERQLHGGAGLLFKGSGFYLTDYGKNAHRSSSKGEGAKGEGAKGEGAKGESGKGESAKAESKPDGTSARTETAPKTEPPKPKVESKPAKKPKAE